MVRVERKERNLKKEVQKKGLEIVKNEKGKQKSCEERLEEECPVGTQSRTKTQGEGARERRGNIRNRADRAEGGRAQTNEWKTVLRERKEEERRTKGNKAHSVLQGSPSPPSLQLNLQKAGGCT